MTQAKTQEIQEKSNALEIQSTYSYAETTYSAGVFIYATEDTLVTMFDEVRVLDQIKIYNKWTSTNLVPKPYIEVHTFKALKSGKRDDRSHKKQDYDARYMNIGLTADLLSDGIKAYYAQAEQVMKGK
jgi:hypothetical protein